MAEDQVDGQLPLFLTPQEVMEETVRDLHTYGWWPIAGCRCDDCARAHRINNERRLSNGGI